MCFSGLFMLSLIAVVAATAAYASPIMTPAFLTEVQRKATWEAGINERFLNATREDIKKLLGAKIEEGKSAHSKLPVWTPEKRVELPDSVRCGVHCPPAPFPPSPTDACAFCSLESPPPPSPNPQFDVRSNWPVCKNVTGHIEDQVRSAPLCTLDGIRSFRKWPT